MKKASKTCRWIETDIVFCRYKTECGNSTKLDYNVKNMEYAFCPFCGKRIEEWK